jgi:hypothetical protein
MSFHLPGIDFIRKKLRLTKFYFEKVYGLIKGIWMLKRQDILVGFKNVVHFDDQRTSYDYFKMKNYNRSEYLNRNKANPGNTN